MEVNKELRKVMFESRELVKSLLKGPGEMGYIIQQMLLALDSIDEECKGDYLYSTAKKLTRILPEEVTHHSSPSVTQSRLKDLQREGYLAIRREEREGLPRQIYHGLTRAGKSKAAALKGVKAGHEATEFSLEDSLSEYLKKSMIDPTSSRGFVGSQIAPVIERFKAVTNYEIDADNLGITGDLEGDFVFQIYQDFEEGTAEIKVYESWDQDNEPPVFKEIFSIPTEGSLSNYLERISRIMEKAHRSLFLKKI